MQFKTADSSEAAPVENHRNREKGVLVYPVYSRRSGGLSVGINLFPGHKCCSYDCPYCEVFPFSADAVFSLKQMEEDLRAFLSTVKSATVKDICFSGNGEPTLSPHFPEALELAGRIRSELAPAADLVLITNGSTLPHDPLFSLLADAVHSLGLDIWLKLDAGTPGWFEKMNGPEPLDNLFGEITEKIKEFAACAAVTLQTMLCAVDGKGPPDEEAEAWEKLVLDMALNAAIPPEGADPSGKVGVRKVQIYGKARPSPEDPKAAALPVEYLEKRAASLRAALAAAFAQTPASPSGQKLAPAPPPVEVYP